MKTKQTFYWPLKEKLAMNLNKVEIKLAGFLVKKNIKLKYVKSIFNISYTSQKEPYCCYDFHIPTNFTAPLPCIIYFHGGALLSGDKSLYTHFLKQLAGLGFAVFNVNYCLMPNAEIENIISNCVSAIKHIIKNSTKYSINPNQVVMGGDSAGAYLASYLITQFQAGNFKTKPNLNFIGCFLYYGMFDLTKFNKIKFPILSAMHNRYVKLFDMQEKESFEKLHPNKKYVSCIKRYRKSNLFNYYKQYSTTTHLTKNFPPTFLASGKIDKLHPQTKQLLAQLKKLKIKTTAVIFPAHRKDAQHAFLNAEFLPSAKQTKQQLEQFLLGLINRKY